MQYSDQSFGIFQKRIEIPVVLKVIDKKPSLPIFKADLEDCMKKKAFFEYAQREANIAFSQVFDQIEIVSKISAGHLEIDSLKSPNKKNRSWRIYLPTSGE